MPGNIDRCLPVKRVMFPHNAPLTSPILVVSCRYKSLAASPLWFLVPAVQSSRLILSPKNNLHLLFATLYKYVHLACGVWGFPRPECCRYAPNPGFSEPTWGVHRCCLARDNIKLGVHQPAPPAISTSNILPTYRLSPYTFSVENQPHWGPGHLLNCNYYCCRRCVLSFPEATALFRVDSRAQHCHHTVEEAIKTWLLCLVPLSTYLRRMHLLVD